MYRERARAGDICFLYRRERLRRPQARLKRFAQRLAVIALSATSPADDQLGSMPIAALRARYRELFRSDPPPAFGPDLLRRSIAQQIQENAYGGLSREAKKLLGQLVRSMASGNPGRLEVPQRIKPGSELVRIWNGQTHKVTVLAKGFA
ncbi:MAG: DUF2924 domain-containing protein [Pseudomonadota bacterium]|uniref:DUF2924 domain-containing protein n=1 Tax=Bradyrhizobium sp. TaxID=376 RepID=UPI00351E78A5